MYKIKITKLEELENAFHPNNIRVNAEYFIEVEDLISPKIGERFGNRWGFSTSLVQEILSDNTFKTLNSVYKWEVKENE